MLIDLRTHDNHLMDPSITHDEKCHLGDVIYTGEGNNIKEVFELAINEQVNLSNVYLFNEDLSSLTISNINLSNSSLAKCNFTGAIFTNVDFIGANLSESNFTGAIFTNVDFTGSNLSDSNFTDVLFVDCVLTNTSIKSTIGNDKEIISKKYGPYIVARNDTAVAVGCYQRDIDFWLTLPDDNLDSIFKNKFEKDIWLKYKTSVINDLKSVIQNV